MATKTYTKAQNWSIVYLNTYTLKEVLKNVNLDEECTIASLDIVGIYPSVTIKKAVEFIPE